MGIPEEDNAIIKLKIDHKFLIPTSVFLI